MTRDDIIWLAREAGFSVSWPETVVNFERFAELVAAAERANVTLAAFQVAERQIAAEREACAKEAENENNFDATECGIDVANDIAAAIRARGEE